MSSSFFRTALAGALAVLLVGCASVPQRAGYAAVQELVDGRSGTTPVWHTDSVAARMALDTVAALLRQDLSADGAVRIALLANPALQGTFEELGLSRADVVQAGLLSNPSLSLGRFLEGGFQEFGIAQSFVDLIQLPMRRRVATAAFEATSVRVAAVVYEHITEVRAAYFSVLAAQQLYEMRRTTTQSVVASARAAEAISAAGNLRDLDLVGEQALAVEARAEELRARGALVQAREALVRTLGVAVPGDSLRLVERLVEPRTAPPALDSLMALAVQHRLDIAAALRDIETASRALGFTKRFRLLADGTLTVDGERDGTTTAVGPGLSLAVPLFDRGQARVSRAESGLRQTIARQRALTVIMQTDVRSTYGLLMAARDRSILYRDSILPLRRRVIDETVLQYNAMAIGVFGLLQAKQAEIAAGQGYIDALRDYWIAQANLERAVGTRLR